MSHEGYTNSHHVWLEFIMYKRSLHIDVSYFPADVSYFLADVCTQVYTRKTTRIKLVAVESRFLERSISRTSRYLEPNLVSLGFASLKLYNFTPDFSNPRFLETPDNSNQFWFPWDKLTLDKISKPLSADVNYIHAFLLMMRTSIICTKVPGTFLKS